MRLCFYFRFNYLTTPLPTQFVAKQIMNAVLGKNLFRFIKNIDAIKLEKNFL